MSRTMFFGILKGTLPEKSLRAKASVWVYAETLPEAQARGVDYVRSYGMVLDGFEMPFHELLPEPVPDCYEAGRLEQEALKYGISAVFDSWPVS